MRNRMVLMQQISEGAATAVLERPVGGCCHHWLIEKPDGPTSHGICKLCHEEKDFSNSPPEYGSRREYDFSTPKAGVGFSF